MVSSSNVLSNKFINGIVRQITITPREGHSLWWICKQQGVILNFPHAAWFLSFITSVRVTKQVSPVLYLCYQWFRFMFILCLAFFAHSIGDLSWKTCNYLIISYRKVLHSFCASTPVRGTPAPRDQRIISKLRQSTLSPYGVRGTGYLRTGTPVRVDKKKNTFV